MGEHLVAEDGLGDLRGVDEVHLEETGLKGSLLGLVLLKRVKEEGRGLLDHVLAHEDVDDLEADKELACQTKSEAKRGEGGGGRGTNTLDVDEGSALVVNEGGRELGTSVGVGPRDVLKETGVVGRIADLLGIEDLGAEGRKSVSGGRGYLTRQKRRRTILGYCPVSAKQATTLLGMLARR